MGMFNLFGKFSNKKWPSISADEIRKRSRILVIDDEDFAFAAFQRVGWNAVVAHKAEQFSARNAAEPAAGDAEAFELARVETANDGLLADFADFGCFAGGEDTLHANHLFP